MEPEKDGADGSAENTNSDDPCDESKCVSDQFCYGVYRSAVYGMACADGFVPRVVEEEPPLNLTRPSWTGGSLEFRYFTCCPPGHQSSGRRHCSDPTEVGDQNQGKSAVCDNQGARAYPHEYKITLQGKEAFACCDSNRTIDSDTSFLEDTECVPYNNDSNYALGEYEHNRNEIGAIRPLSCSLSDFPIPRLLEPDPFFSLGRYECCKSGPAYRYVTDSAFKISISIELIVYSIAAIASAIVAIGLLIPLLIQLKKGNNQRPTRRRRRNTNDMPSYSTYNLYLVYLAIPDLLYALWRIGINARMVLQKEVPDGAGSMASRGWSLELLLIYMMINLCINAIVSYQVLVLLKCSRAARRIEQPTLMRVNMQASIVFVAATLLGVLTAVIPRFPPELLIVGGVGIPIVFVLVVSVLILYRKYLPSSSGSLTPLEKAMRTLAIYFFRIVYVFLGVWMPGISILLLDSVASWPFFVFLCTPAVQAVVSTSMILTKPDVRKYVWNLLTLYTKGDQGGPNGSTGINRATASTERVTASAERGSVVASIERGSATASIERGSVTAST